MFKIDKGIPIPVITETRGSQAKYPFSRMVVGDSFLVPYENPPPDNNLYKKLVTSRHNWKKKGFDYLLHREDKGIRVFRTK